MLFIKIASKVKKILENNIYIPLSHETLYIRSFFRVLLYFSEEEHLKICFQRKGLHKIRSLKTLTPPSNYELFLAYYLAFSPLPAAYPPLTHKPHLLNQIYKT